MTRRFKQLQAEERVTLAALRLQGMGLRGIAEVLGRNAGSLSRELRRNAGSDGAYLSQQAQVTAQERRRAARGTVKLDPAGPKPTAHQHRFIRTAQSSELWESLPIRPNKRPNGCNAGFTPRRALQMPIIIQDGMSHE